MLSNGETVETKLQRIAEKARQDPRCKFTSLFHLMDVDLLRGCFARLRRDAAAGIDQVTKEEYQANLEENLRILVDKIHRMAYRPLPVRRVYIPKLGSNKQRPLGIPAIEDKLVQAGLARLLTAIYEQDFIADSYGFRPGRSCHDALRSLSHEVERKPVNHIVGVDIKGFFDNVEHKWLMQFLAHRVADKRVLRYTERFLKAGIMEDGALLDQGDEGTPQGGIISPILANIYLHYTLDLWFERKFRKSCWGNARLIRYADDWVTCFQRGDEAVRFRCEVEERLAQFGLEVSPEKTKVLEFGPMAEARAKRCGGKPHTFDFLGFTHYCSRARGSRRFRMKRITSRKKFTAKLRAFKEWLKASRTLPARELMAKVVSKIQGHFAYYGVTDNSPGLLRFSIAVRRLLFKWLNRRGKRDCMKWDKFRSFLGKFPLPKPIIRVHLLT
ncbi:group II intron reverse transcriptase/maturase [Desulfurivibrio sp. D14AmB]|uniref:group II intron reverse transcriptase/maturase n=1 Tax=Desulfurivibrio sp. D14AmB TaxID=3374370 RepID=UPI00376F1214